MPAIASRPAEQASAEPCDHDFAVLRTAYRVSGDIARGDDQARFLSEHHSGDFVSLAMSVLEGDGSPFNGSRRSGCRCSSSTCAICRSDPSPTHDGC